jgi:hypothetical protein
MIKLYLYPFHFTLFMSVGILQKYLQGAARENFVVMMLDA